MNLMTGDSDDGEFAITLPGFLEVEPGNFKPLETCLRREIESEIRWLTAQAEVIQEELPPHPSRDQLEQLGDLVFRAKSLDWYLENQ
ncbi:hypothetical protein [Mycobacterium riyadhense]|uniref:Uncharacterized protein n=1 Tax=Mycobacterium riyadhense TaxID=486698 RepID=A0A1X2BK12_9MYCO|nr:hypothetical protein [Mycobacterium riyadhense]MCV7148052.1 hypothetical protein [Mycobacterium riyadhense]ORW63539.1 hypothetical protein AWC22_00485 [Mycobacterium riyadhense]VTO96527.1 hypothetical protein BIN_B_01594 [Mycobacterium riyadhense]